MFAKILIPLDGSTLAEQALTHAPLLGDAEKGQLLAAMVLPPLLIEPSPRAADSISQARHEQFKEAEDYLASLSTPLQLIPRVLVGSAAESLLDLAEREEVDLILMTSHGRSGLERWLFGSTAERILRYAPCPVMVVKNKPD